MQDTLELEQKFESLKDQAKIIEESIRLIIRNAELAMKQVKAFKELLRKQGEKLHLLHDALKQE